MEVDVQNGVQIAGVGQGSSGALILGPRRFIPFILVIVLTVAAVVTAVLSTGSPAGGATTVRAALASMMDAKSVTFALNVNLSGAASAQATVDGSCATGPECQVNFSASSGSTNVGQSEVVIDHGVLYVELAGSLASKLPTPWVSAPLNSSSAQQSTGISGVGSLSSVFAGLAKVGDAVTDDGPVTLNGVATHEYSISASQATEQQQLETVLKALPSTDASLLGAVTLGGYNVNIYIGPDGNIAEVDLTTSMTTAQGSESLALRLGLSGYGQPVSVTVPPANEVTPLSSLMTKSLTGL